MTQAEQLFHQIAAGIPDTREGKMFGALCIKASNGKSGAMFWKEYMVFKLEGTMLTEALQLKGAQLFDPMGGRPMKDWVQVPYSHSHKWVTYTKAGMELVKNLKK